MVNTVAYKAHMIRAGDADSLYVLLFTLAMLFMLEIPKDWRNFCKSGICFSIAFLTKSYHAFIIIVILGCYLLITGEWRKLKQGKIISYFCSFCLPILIWIILRFWNDGILFFKEMLYSDVLQRTKSGFDSIQYPFNWYLTYLFGAGFGKVMVYWWVIVICIVGCYVYHKTLLTHKNKDMVGCFLWIIIPFLAFSSVSSKRLWYVYPSLIPLLILAGVILGKLISDKQFPLILRGFTFVAAFFLLVYYTKDVYFIINQQERNDFQDFIEVTGEKLSDTEAYLFLDIGDEWSQQDVFVAEIYGNYFCKSGGLHGFLNSENQSVLFISLENYKQLKEVKDFVIIADTDEYLAIINASNNSSQ